jgi:hypothetical protein
MKLNLAFVLSGFTIAVVYFMYNDYLNYLLKKTELNIETLPRVDNEIDDEGNRNFTMVYGVPESTSSTIHMLFWNTYILGSAWGHAEQTIDQEFLNNSKCPETDCILTHKIDYLPSILDYDAVMINAFNINMTVPKLRSPHQLYIMSANE